MEKERKFIIKNILDMRYELTRVVFLIIFVIIIIIVIKIIIIVVLFESILLQDYYRCQKKDDKCNGRRVFVCSYNDRDSICFFREMDRKVTKRR